MPQEKTNVMEQATERWISLKLLAWKEYQMAINQKGLFPEELISATNSATYYYHAGDNNKAIEIATEYLGIAKDTEFYHELGDILKACFRNVYFDDIAS